MASSPNGGLKKNKVAVSEESYIEHDVLILVGQVAIALIVTVALFSWIGVYGELPLFLIFYLRFIGNRSWRMSILFAVLVPIITFFFFEITPKITLPKGVT
ncbi:MAG: tripartite tricarboxylate transporter TctB family protein [Gammaproteobacteria bacterium]|nr:tripartite tricarboxylate transporter TctB family protein [Gammaproteobacteria bacterium]